jgi:hypothetical protein
MKRRKRSRAPESELGNVFAANPTAQGFSPSRGTPRPGQRVGRSSLGRGESVRSILAGSRAKASRPSRGGTRAPGEGSARGEEPGRSRGGVS